jgi:dihydrolipoamide dehydrogenase
MVVGEMAEPVQVLVVGGGPGGYTAAARAAELGKDVVLIERQRLGGVCLNVGCIPSKVLTTAAHDMTRAASGAERGLHADIKLDFGALQASKAAVVDRLVGGVGQVLARVRVVEGTAYFLDANRVSVENGDQVSHYRFEHAIIATGSEPIQLPDLPVDQKRIVDSTGALAFDEVPENLAVVGGGYIGTELGMAYARLGARVTLVEATEGILTGFDDDLARTVSDHARAIGIDVRTSTFAKALDGDDLLVMGPEGEGRVPADKVLVAVGRRPLVGELQLEDLGIELTPSGHIAVDEQCRTNVTNIFAIGDVVEGPALAHKASAEGRVAAEVICGLPSAFDSVVPLIAFTDPEVASVGLTEAEAKAEGRKVLVGRNRFSTSGRAVILGEEAGLVKIVVDAETDVVLGIHIAGPNASDLIGEATLAVETACRAEDLAATVHPHPTLIESLHEAALAALRRAKR